MQNTLQTLCIHGTSIRNFPVYILAETCLINSVLDYACPARFWPAAEVFGCELVNWIANSLLNSFCINLGPQVSIMAVKLAILMFGVSELLPGLSCLVATGHLVSD